MPEYLIGFSYHDPQAYEIWQRGEVEDFESSTGVWIAASSAEEALLWGEQIARALQRHTNGGQLDNWHEAGHGCWVEESPTTSSWAHCLDFFTHVQAGEMPPMEQLGTEAYIRWQKVQRS